MAIQFHLNRTTTLPRICILILVHCSLSVSAQISSFKMGDTLFLKPDDEFRDVRLSKFSAEKEDGDIYNRTLVYYNGKPFTGTIVKSQGVYHDGIEIIGSFAAYEDSESDNSFFCINYLNGRFYKDYFFSNEFVDIKLFFDKNGNPDKSGFVVVKENKSSDKQNVPVLIPPFIRLSDRFTNGKLVIDLYDDTGLGVFDQRGNKANAPFLPLGSQSLAELVEKYSIQNPELNECNLKDTIFFSFSDNHLLNFSYKDDCESKITFNNTDYVNNLPVFDAANSGGDGFFKVDYSNLLFSGGFDELSANRFYYIESILSSGQGYFFGQLESLPKWAKITTQGYTYEVHFDYAKAMREAKRKLFKEVFYEKNYKGSYRDPIYYVSFPIKSFSIRCDQKDQDGTVKHIKTDYSVSENEQYELSSEYWYGADTITISTTGDLKNVRLDKFDFQVNQNEDGYGAINNLQIRYTQANSYLLTVKGKLAWDARTEKNIVSFETEAVRKGENANYPAVLELISNGKSTFTYKDGTKKTYQYKKGVLIID